MKKKSISIIALSISLAFVTGCTVQKNDNTTTHEQTSLSQQQPAMSDITRDYLLATDRLNTIDGDELLVISDTEVAKVKASIINAKAGEEIILPAGKYPNLGQLTMLNEGVTVRAETAGSVWLTGLIQFELKGDNITLDGLVFTQGGPNERFGGIRMMGDHNTVANSTFYYFNHDYAYEPDERRAEYPKYIWLSLWGKEGKVINNRFEGKQKRGTLIGIQKDDQPDNHIIANNIFLDQEQNQFNELDIKEAIRYNGNSWEAIRIGDSKASQWDSNTQFIDNLMINMSGERELISVKSGGNNISGNTIFESESLISLRHGKGNFVENNIILGNGKKLTGGMRIYDEDHVIKNNYISGTRGKEGEISGNADLRGAIVINTGIIDVENNEKLDQAVKGKELNKQWTPKNIKIENNTIVDTEYGIVYGNQTHRVSLFNNDVVENIYTGADIQFSNNIVDNSKNAQFMSVRAVADHPLINATYTNEHYAGTITAADQLSNFSTMLPEKELINGIESYAQVGADTSKLKIVTAETAGPNYQLINATQ